MSSEQTKEREVAKADSKPHEPTPSERAAEAALAARMRERSPAPRMKASGANLAPDHKDYGLAMVLLMDALGTTDLDFLNGLVSQLCNAASQGTEIDEPGLNFMLAMVMGVEPKDEVESMLAAQMAAVHMATMTFARRLNHVENIKQQDSSARAFNKLARTFTAQVEALKRYRSDGEQKVTVEHVHVHEGGQAIVGNIEAGVGGHQKKKGEQRHEQTATHAPGAPLRNPDETRHPLPTTSHAGEEAVQASRGKEHRAAEGKHQCS